MRAFWYAAHLIGFVAWMGGAFAAMIVGRASLGEPRPAQWLVVRLQNSLFRALVGPGAMVTVVSGLLLTLGMYGGATSVGGLPRPLIVMELAGIVGGVISLVVILPTAGRLSRIDPMGEYGPAFDRLRMSVMRWNLIAVMLAVAALVAAAL